MAFRFVEIFSNYVLPYLPISVFLSPVFLSHFTGQVCFHDVPTGRSTQINCVVYQTIFPYIRIPLFPFLVFYPISPVRYVFMTSLRDGGIIGCPPVPGADPSKAGQGAPGYDDTVLTGLKTPAPGHETLSNDDKVRSGRSTQINCVV